MRHIRIWKSQSQYGETSHGRDEVRYGGASQVMEEQVRLCYVRSISNQEMLNLAIT